MRSMTLVGLVILTSVVGLMHSVCAAARFPIKVGQNHRTLVDQQERPYFINGDAAWSLIGQVSREDVEFYLQDCTNRSINSILVTLVEGHYAVNAPANYYGVQPFLTTNKFTTPNEAYFAHADWVINKAAEYGILILLAPLYLGCCDDGWYSALKTENSEADARWYGEWVGERYKNFPNLIYSWGNDRISGDVRDKIRALAEGAKSRDPIKLQTYHASSGVSSLDEWTISETWLDLNATYTYNPVQVKCLEDYHRDPFLPCFLFESAYESDWLNADAIRTRRQIYTAVLCGANGHYFGNNPIWHMNGNPSVATTPWKDHLNDEGRAGLPHVSALFESRDWFKFVPDDTHQVLIAGYGNIYDSDYVAAARASDGATVMAYLPSQREVIVQMDKILGNNAKCWWFNPRDGTAQMIGSYSTSGSKAFTSPTTEDWVLVIDDASKNFSPPGSTSLETNYPPVSAGFFAGITSGLAPLTVAFSNQSLNATDYAWNFGDGQTSTDPQPLNTYSNAGSYSVTLTARGPGGTNTLTRTDYVVVTNYPTVSADFFAGVTSGLAPLTVAFSNQSLNATDYAWNFGDGQVSTNIHPSNTYASAGNYSVTLTARGPGGTNTLVRANYVVVVDKAKITLGTMPQTASQISAEGFKLWVSADAPGIVTLERTTNFIQWSDIVTIQYASGITNITDTNALQGIPAYYRARQR